jgi:hypothetical protein
VVQRVEQGHGIDTGAGYREPAAVGAHGRTRREVQHGGGQVDQQAAHGPGGQQPGQLAGAAAHVQNGPGAGRGEPVCDIRMHIVVRVRGAGQEPLGVSVVVGWED